MSISPAEHIARLRLIRTENIGPMTFRQLLRKFGSAAEALRHLPDLASRGGKKLAPVSEKSVEGELRTLEKMGGRLLHDTDPDYPETLKAVEDAPPVLSVVGNTKILGKPCVALVGARNASANGRHMAQHLAAKLGEHHYIVVSGLARGIDAAAHRGALESGTIGVVGGGVDVIYPPENKDLYAALYEKGIVVSEAPLGTYPQARHFPRRNRIISGLSLGVVVVEAALKSGSLITARMAGEQGREVMAVPGSPMDPRCRGTNKLLKDGARLVENVEDILDELSAPSSRFRMEEPEIVADFSEEIAPEERADREALMMNLLSLTPVGVDELIRQCQLSYSQVANLLLELELAGRIQRHAGNRVSRVYLEGVA